jgi:hypothetical protein
MTPEQKAELKKEEETFRKNMGSLVTFWSKACCN